MPKPAGLERPQTLCGPRETWPPKPIVRNWSKSARSCWNISNDRRAGVVCNYSLRPAEVIPFSDNNRHLFQTVGPCCLVALKQSEGGCAAIMPGGAAGPYPLHRLSLGIGIIPPADPGEGC